jgi:antitoxin component YwqK of YwqJK toxin-antitoxin module
VIALLAALLLVAPPVLECPKGTSIRGAAPPEEFEAWCEGPDGYGVPRRHGPARRWYDDGTLWIEEAFVDGVRSGPFLEHHRNGRKAREGRYEQGLKVGTWTIWSERGVVEERSTFTRGVSDGPFEAFYPSGARRLTGRHCLGAQCGTWTTYAEDGKVVGTVVYEEQSVRP